MDVEWQPFAAHVQSCPVADPEGKLALEIIAVSALGYYKAAPEGAEIVTLPRPMIRLANGNLAGRLLYNYPDDPPVATTLEFARWQAGIPHQITIHVQDPTVSGNHDLTPMLWDGTAGRYEGGKEQ